MQGRLSMTPKLGDFVLVNRKYGVAFHAGEVLWCSPDYILLMDKDGDYDRPMIMAMDCVVAIGSKATITSLNKTVQALLVKRNKAMAAAEARLNTVADQHEGVVRRTIRNYSKRKGVANVR